MLNSREYVVSYMTPLGLHHIMGWDHHYGPSPWIKDKPRADWTSVYYHKAEKNGIGFNRTSSGSNAVGQYFSEVEQLYGSLETCPEKYLLWFHHLPWDHRMASGMTLWEELQAHYQKGVDYVKFMQNAWSSLNTKIDPERFKHVQNRLTMQFENAVEWRDTCLEYFGSFIDKGDSRKR